MLSWHTIIPHHTTIFQKLLVLSEEKTNMPHQNHSTLVAVPMRHSILHGEIILIIIAIAASSKRGTLIFPMDVKVIFFFLN